MKEQLDVLNLLVKLTTSSALILASLFPSMSIAQPLATPTAPPVRSTRQKLPSPPPVADKEEVEEEEKEPQEEAEEPEEGGGTESISPK